MAADSSPASIPYDRQNGIQNLEELPLQPARPPSAAGSVGTSPPRSTLFSSPSFPFLAKEAILSHWPKQALQLEADSRWDVHPTSSWVGKARTVKIHRDSCAVIACPPGEVLSPSELPRPRENSQLENCIAVVSMGVLFGLVYLLPLAALVSIYAVWTAGSSLALAFLTLLILDFFAPPSQVWPSFRHWTLWDIWRRYFRLCVIIPPMPVLTPGKQYLVCQFPHCVFPMGCWLTSCVIEHWTTGGTYIEAVVASVMFQLPVIRRLVAWIGCHPADRSMMVRLLGTICVGILPEGLAGIVRGACPEHERVAMLSHKGFCSVAIQAGTDILPVYHMGNSQQLSFQGWPWLTRKVRVMVGLFWGRWYLPIPRQHDLITLVGTPIHVKQNDAPTKAEVEALHLQVQQAITGLYQTHRHLLPGWESRPMQLC